MGHISDVTPQVQIHPDLFQLCHRRIAAAWFIQGILAGHKANIQMPSLGWLGL
jgi:hypothetical protein